MDDFRREVLLEPIVARPSVREDGDIGLVAFIAAATMSDCRQRNVRA